MGEYFSNLYFTRTGSTTSTFPLKPVTTGTRGAATTQHGGRVRKREAVGDAGRGVYSQPGSGPVSGTHLETLEAGEQL